MSQQITSRKTTYVKAALFIILVLVAGFFLVIFFLAGIIGALLTGDFTLFFGGVIFFIISMALTAVARRLEPAWEEFERIRGIRPKTRREALKESLPFFGTILFTIVFAWIFESYFVSFHPTISPDLAKEILKAILTVDGILIGFYGVILAQVLSAIHSRGNVIYEQMIEKREDEPILQELNREVERLGRSRMLTIGAVFYSMMPLLASILLCLSRLTLIEATNQISTRELMFDPILAMIVGIVLLALTMLQTNPLPKMDKPKS